MDNIFLFSFLVGIVVSCFASYVLVWRNTLRLRKRFISEVNELEKEIGEQIRIIGRDELKKTRAGQALLRGLQNRANNVENEYLKLHFTFNEALLLKKLLIGTMNADMSERIRKYSVGEKIIVKILRVVDFGAFAEIEPGVEGLIHKSKMAWDGALNPNQIVKVGDLIEVNIDMIDLDNRQIGLSMLMPKGDPLSKYKVGDKLTGTIKKIISAGLIVELEPGVSGFVHISQVANGFVSLEELNNQLRIGEEVKVVVLRIEMETRKLSLSIKQA